MHNQFRKLSVFIDESSQTKHRFLTLGSLVIDQDIERDFVAALLHARALDLPQGEMKWAKVSNAKLFAYKLVVDQFFDFLANGMVIHFHTTVIDTSKIKDEIFNSGDREVGFNKEIYQLLMKCASMYSDSHFKIYLDHRETNSSLEELRTILNNGIKKKGDNRVVPFRQMQFCNSKNFMIIQLVDVLLGAITFKINGHSEKDDVSPSKLHLCNYILDRAKITNPAIDTPKNGKFTIWHRRLR